MRFIAGLPTISGGRPAIAVLNVLGKGRCLLIRIRTVWDFFNGNTIYGRRTLTIGLAVSGICLDQTEGGEEDSCQLGQPSDQHRREFLREAKVDKQTSVGEGGISKSRGSKAVHPAELSFT